MTIQQAIQQATRSLADISDAPDLDAIRILLHVTGLQSTASLIASSHSHLLPAQLTIFEEALAERATGKPLAYILETWGFYGRMFKINKHVLVPRPETEELVRTALMLIQALSEKKERPIILADIGTGSGCIGITLLLESTLIQHIFATDISEHALTVARQNAALHRVEDRLTHLPGDMLEPLIGRDIDLIVSNPPYIPTAELTKEPTIETRGLSFEPRIALNGGPDGTLYVKQIAASGIPSVIEGIHGNIQTFNLP